MAKRVIPFRRMKTLLPFLLLAGLLFFLVGSSFADVSPEAKKRLASLAKNQKNEFAKRSHDVGRFRLPISNYGLHGQHETAGGSGGEWPNGSRDYYIFGAGIWIAGKIDGDRRVACGYNPSDGNFEFYPGTLPNNDGEVGKDEILYLSTDGEDYANWPLRKEDGTAKIVSVQDSWATYNDMNSIYTFSTQKPLGVRVIQRGYAWNYTTNKDIVFLTFDIINITNDPNYPDATKPFLEQKTPAPPPNTTIRDMYIGPGVDPDIGDATDDMLDFDAARNLGIVWDFNGIEANFDLDLNGDGKIGDTGVLGYDFLESPIADRDVDVNGDGVVNDDSVNYGTAANPIWVKDVKKGEQLGLTAFKIFVLQIDPRTDEERYDLMSGYDYRTMIPGGDSLYVPFDLDKSPEDKRFVQCTGPFDLAPGDTVRTVVAIMVAANRNELKKLSDLAQAIYDNNYFLPFPPKAAKLRAIEGDRMATLLWDDSAEDWEDPFAKVAMDPNSLFYDPNYVAKDFQGYRVYRSLTGIPGSWVKLAEFDKADGYTSRIDTIIYKGMKWPQEIVFGTDNGLQHQYIDTDVQNGVAYYYAVTSFDFQPKSVPITLECAEVNKLVVVPRAEQAGYQAAEVTLTHVQGYSDAPDPEVNLIDPLAVTGHVYEFTFTDSMLAPIDASKLGSKKFWHLFDHDANRYLLRNQNVFGAFVGAGQLYYGSAESGGVDGMILKVNDLTSASTTLTKVEGKDKGKTAGVLGYWSGRNVKVNNDYRDYEYRYTGWTNEKGDTLNYGIEIASLGVTNPRKVACPFELWDVGYFKDLDKNGVDDDTTDNVRLWPMWAKIGGFHFILDKNHPNTKYSEDFFGGTHHPDSTIYWKMDQKNPRSRPDWDYMVIGMAVSKEDTTWKKGDVWRLINLFPIVTGPNGDKWTLNTSAIQVVKSRKSLDEIKVVPNPFLIADDFMRDPAYKEIHFTHLPAQCTIRIFTVAGDLVQEIRHDQPGNESDGYEPWNLLSKNDQLVASGVYIVHVDAPGYGQKVGKFAVIVK